MQINIRNIERRHSWAKERELAGHKNRTRNIKAATVVVFIFFAVALFVLLVRMDTQRADKQIERAISRQQAAALDEAYTQLSQKGR